MPIANQRAGRGISAASAAMRLRAGRIVVAGPARAGHHARRRRQAARCGRMQARAETRRDRLADLSSQVMALMARFSPAAGSRRKGGAMLQDISALTPPVLMCAVVLLAIGAFLRHEMNRK